MEKVVLVAWRGPGAAPSDDADAVARSLRAAGEELAAAGRYVTVGVERPEAAAMRVDDPGDDLVLTGILSVWLEQVEQVDDLPRIDAERVATYLVTESILRDHPGRDWDDGSPSPGVSLVSAIRRRPDLDDPTFYGRWHGSHGVLTLEVHPVTRYVRNAVVRPLSADAPVLDGIVQDGFASDADLLEPERMFGAGEPEIPWQEGLRRVSEDLERFIDVDRVAATPMTETILRSAPWEARCA